ncbi:PASTA domain-containing protein [Lentzea aerocolonigenes]|uniref:PASTA domain-containing protein n=1 Tax=Lentzea aerocolonigenes TaxID=68170 RepID=UPI0007C4C1FC|nr:PASTA domain-containing protein [Lentzea aerocolonigenes]MCP2250615.1 PASTA domain-containing protein [Lentzea aerocolonigenes]
MKIVIALLVLVLAGCAGAEPRSPAPRSSATTASSASPVPSGPKMPEVVQMRLTEARELLRAQGYRVTEEDETGQNRQILEPLNWVVASQLPEAGAEAPSGTQVVLKVRKPTDSSTSGEPRAKGAVPNVVCLDLQKAQDTLQAAGFYLLGSEDATGQRRQQLVDRNWVVVSQSEPPGSTPDPKTKITLGAVKFGESTGTSGCKS